MSIVTKKMNNIGMKYCQNGIVSPENILITIVIGEILETKDFTDRYVKAGIIKTPTTTI